MPFLERELKLKEALIDVGARNPQELVAKLRILKIEIREGTGDEPDLMERLALPEAYRAVG